MIDGTDRAIINRLQDGLPVCARPYAAAAEELGISEADLIGRLERLLEAGVLSRFGPMYHAEKLGGALTLAAMRVPPEDFDRIAEIVNAFPQVAHNYERENAFNMWFVLATERPEEIDSVIAEIEERTGLEVINLPKLEEFYVGLRFAL